MLTYKPNKPCKRGHWLRYTKSRHCVKCAKANSIKWKTANPEQHIKQNRQWEAKNPEKIYKSKKLWVANNRKQHNLATSRWQKNNKAVCRASYKRYMTRKSKALPIWLTPDDHWMIEQAYELAELRSKMTGVKHHVDHEWPLQGKTVCGLHVPLNLKVIPAIDNLRKHNKCPQP